MPSTITILTAIQTTSPLTWSAFVKNLPDKPVAYADPAGWRELLQSVGALEAMELIEVERDRNSNDILTLALTNLGVERLRESEVSDQLAIERRKKRIETDRLGGMLQRPRGAYGLGRERQ